MQAGVVVATIAQGGAIGNQGGGGQVTSRGSRPIILRPLKGGGDLMEAGHYFRLVGKDTGSSDKMKESQPSSSSRKKQKIFASYGPAGADEVLPLPQTWIQETGLPSETRIPEL